MRHFAILSLAFSGSLLLLGCDKKSPTSSNASEKLKTAEHSTTEAAKAARDEYTLAMHKRLDEFDVKCREFEARISKAEGQAKKDLEKKYEATKGKREAAYKKLEELKAASDERWLKVKDGVGSAFDDLKKEFE